VSAKVSTPLPSVNCFACEPSLSMRQTCLVFERCDLKKM
jgi:hypothetical protein